jgi:hypothetical protein
LNSRGKVGFTIKYSVASLIILPIAFLIGSNFGLKGVAVSWLLAFPIIYLYLMILLRSTLDLPIGLFLKSSYSVYIASLLMAIFVIGAKSLLGESELLLRFTVSIATGVIVYLGTFFILFPKQIEDVKKAVKVLRQKEI